MVYGSSTAAAAHGKKKGIIIFLFLWQQQSAIKHTLTRTSRRIKSRSLIGMEARELTYCGWGAEGASNEMENYS